MKKVPWFSKDEWLDVKGKLESESFEDNLRAYQLLLMWKSRCAQLPANIECTLGILQGMILKNLNTAENDFIETLFAHETNIQLAYSTSLVRFVNHVSAATSKLGETLYLAARKQDIPDWVVNLRHDIAHGASLPSVELLESALQLAKRWLLENYWNVVEKRMSGVAGSKMKSSLIYLVPSSIELLVVPGVIAWWACQCAFHRQLINQYQLEESDWELIHSFITTLEATKVIRDLPDVIEFKALINNILENKDLNVRTKTIQKKIFAILLSVSKKHRGYGKSLLKGMVNAGFLSCGGKQLKSWGPIFKLLDFHDSLQGLLELLFENLSSKDDEEVSLSLSWLETLVPLIKQMCYQWSLIDYVGSEAHCDKIIDLSSVSPPRIRMELLKAVLLQPNPALLRILPHYMILCSPEIPKKSRTKLKKLMKLYLSEPDSEEVNEEVSLWSVEDIPLDEIHEESPNVESFEENGYDVGDAPWQLVPIDVEMWSKCPIGLLPHQLNCDLEMPKLKWQKVTVSRKRKISE